MFHLSKLSRRKSLIFPTLLKARIWLYAEATKKMDCNQALKLQTVKYVCAQTEKRNRKAGEDYRTVLTYKPAAII